MPVPAPTERQRALGQFLTPPSVARFMASLFRKRVREVSLLDAGAGKGTLSVAAVENFHTLKKKPQSIKITAVELDASLSKFLHKNLQVCQSKASRFGISVTSEIRFEDFIDAACFNLHTDIYNPQLDGFTAAILNPPHPPGSGSDLDFRAVR